MLMIFVDRDPGTGSISPTTFASIRSRLEAEHPIPAALPDPVKDRLSLAMDMLALAYEQVNVGRTHLFGPLATAAMTSALLALELRLRQCLPALGKKRKTLGPLIDGALEAGLLPIEQAQIWRELHLNRNQLIHGDPNAPLYGPATAHVIGAIVDQLGRMEPVTECRQQASNSSRS